MQFTPRTEKELAESRLMKKGVYDFEILDARETTSNAGNTMIELKVKVMNGNGGRVLADYLLAKTPEKLLHCASACGLADKYDTGELADSDFRGKRGKLKLAVEKGKNGFPDRNVVADYVAPKSSQGWTPDRLPGK